MLSSHYPHDEQKAGMQMSRKAGLYGIPVALALCLIWTGYNVKFAEMYPPASSGG